MKYGIGELNKLSTSMYRSREIPFILRQLIPVIVVVNVENLQRNLFLASQIAELDVPIVIALNCWDVAEKKGLQIDCKLL